MREPRFETATASVRQSLKIARSGLTLVMKLMRLKQKVEKIYTKTRYPIQTILTCGKLFEVSAVLLMLTLLTKLCPTTVERSPILSLKLTLSLIITPGSANSICHNPTVT